MEALEPRLLLSAQLDALAATTPAWVNAVLVSGEAWTPAADAGPGVAGAAELDYAVAPRPTDQAMSLPWSTVDRITIRFNGPVGVGADDALITGVNVAGYHVTGFAYDDAAMAATWTLSEPIGTDRVLVHLPGSLFGAEAEDLVALFDVVIGDIDASGATTIDDIGAFRTGLGAAGGEATGPSLLDLNTDGVIDGLDVALLRGHVGATAPNGDFFNGPDEIEPSRTHIRGIKWVDANGNGQRDSDEPGLPGVTIYADLNRNGALDRGEPRAVTMPDLPMTNVNEAGHYRLGLPAPGRHQIREIVPSAMVQTFPGPADDGAHTVLALPGVVLDGIDFGNRRLLQPVSLHGQKWLDANGDGERNADEPGLAGVVIYVDVNDNGVLNRGEPHAVSMPDDPDTDFDETGLYAIEGLAPGTHIVREIVPEGLVQTFPGPDQGGAHVVTLTPTGPIYSVDFGNRRRDPAPGSIHGMKWLDANGNGRRDPDERGLPGVTIYVDLNNSGTFDDGEPHAVTMPNIAASPLELSGHYWINDLRAGEYLVREVVPDGFVQTFPPRLIDPLPEPGPDGTPPIYIGDGAHHVFVGPGQVLEGIDFGNRPIVIEPGSIHGVKWLDADGDGQRGPDEPGLPGVTIYIDANHNGVFDRDEPHAVSMRDNPLTDFDEAGRYWIEGVRPGEHVVREVVPDGFEQTHPPLLPAPPPGAGLPGTTAEGLSIVHPEHLDLVIPPGDIAVTDVSLTIEPFCFRPFDVDVVAATPDLQIDNLSGIQLNSCGGDTTTFEIAIVGSPIPVNSELLFVDAEFGGVLGAIPVAIQPPGGGSGAHHVRVEPGQTVEGIDFGNRPIVIEPGSIHGVKWLDADGDGQRGPDEPGLPGVTIYVDANHNGVFDRAEPHAVSMRDDPLTDFDEAGHYWIEGVRPGEHVVREVVPDGFEQTFPLPLPFPPLPLEDGTGADGLSIPGSVHPERLDLTLAAGETMVTEVAFSFAPLCIRPWEVDVVAGTPDLQMENLSGIQLNSCGGDTTVFEIALTGQGVPQHSDLQFVDVLGGSILGFIPVTIRPPGGGHGAHDVHVGSGQTVEGIDFGNRPIVIEPGSIHGVKWLDADGDGQRGPDEPGLPGVTIYVDANHNGVFDRAEPHAVSMRDDPLTDFDEAGRYWIEGVRPGEHVVREVVPDGFVQTFPPRLPIPLPMPFEEGTGAADPAIPASTVHPEQLDLMLAAGEMVVTEVSYSFEPLCIRAWEVDVIAGTPDLLMENLSGIQLNGCGGDTTVFEIAFTGQGVLQQSELLFVDVLGGSVLGVIPVTIRPPGGGAHHVHVQPGQAVEGVDFGNRPIEPEPGSIHGVKWLDADGNGQRGTDEPGLPGVTIYVDTNRNGRPDDGEPRAVTMADDPSTAADEAGHYWIRPVRPGTHIVREVLPDGTVQTFPRPGAGIVASETIEFEPSFAYDFDATGAGISADGTVLVDMTVVWRDGCGMLLPDMTRVEVHGEHVRIDMFGAHEGQACTLALVPETQTIDIGRIAPGDYVIEAVLHGAVAGGFVPTLGAMARLHVGGAAHEVHVAPGQTVEGVDFGNRRAEPEPGSIHGVKWLDANGNGRRDAGEPGVGGVTIYADLNNNGQLENDEPQAVTMVDDAATPNNRTGRYWLQPLRPGDYVIREVVPDGSVQTFPGPGGGVLESDSARIGPGIALGFDLTGVAVGPTAAGDVSVALDLTAIWPDTCGHLIPDMTNAAVVGNDIFVSLHGHQVGDACAEVISPETLSVPLGPLAPGIYAVNAWLHEDVGIGFFIPTWHLRGAVGVRTDDAHRVHVGPGQVVEGINFGNRRADTGAIDILDASVAWEPTDARTALRRAARAAGGRADLAALLGSAAAASDTADDADMLGRWLTRRGN